MSDFLKYKGYLGSVEYSADDNCLFGKVMFIKSLLMYEGETLQELEEMFHETIDEYLADCEAEGDQAECSMFRRLKSSIRT